MEILKKDDIVELINDGKHVKMSNSVLGFLSVEYTHDNKKDDLWFQETFKIEKSDKELYELTDSIFFSYGGQVFFDTEDASLMLRKESTNYTFYFIKQIESANSIRCTIIDDTVENNSMRLFYDKLLNKKTETKDSFKTLTKNAKRG